MRRAEVSGLLKRIAALETEVAILAARRRQSVSTLGAVPSSRSLTAGAGLTGGGDLSADRTFAVGAGTGVTVNADDVALDTSSNRNIDHSSVLLVAGSGLVGGGDITTNRSFTVGAGDDIVVNADDVALASTVSTWSPTITAGSGTLTTVSADLARYRQYGKLVFWWLDATITDAGTGASFLIFTLPVTATAATGNIGSGIETGATLFSLTVRKASTTTARIMKYDGTTIIATGRVVRCSGVYEAA